MRWTLKDASGNAVASGPNTGITFIGGRSDRADDHYFAGSVAGVEVRAGSVDGDAATCAYQSNEKLLGTCDMDDDSVKLSLFAGEDLDSTPRWGIDMNGDAHISDEGYGVVLGGDTDFVKVEVEDQWSTRP